jgi:hypothetical protein
VLGYNLYPNPTNGFTTLGNLTAEQLISVDVFNALGQLIQSFEATADEAGQYTWRLPAGVSGILEVVITANEKRSSTKLIAIQSAE